MNGAERRNRIIDIISNEGGPVSGSRLAKQLEVSRQIIVQDIALLRAENAEIISTTKGYMIMGEKPKLSRVFTVVHTDAQIEEELNLIVDLGGKVKNVMVDHPIYGEIKADLVITSRQDVKDFVYKIKNSETAPLNKLTNGVHRHQIEAENTAVLDKIEEALRAKSYLIEL